MSTNIISKERNYVPTTGQISLPIWVSRQYQTWTGSLWRPSKPSDSSDDDSGIPIEKALSSLPQTGELLPQTGVQIHLEKEGRMKDMEGDLTQDEIYHSSTNSSADDNIMELVKGKRKLR